MGAGASIGSIYTRIGADTSDFQAKLAQSSQLLNNFSGSVNRSSVASGSALLATSRAAGSLTREMRSMAFTVDMVAGSNVAAYAMMGSAVTRTVKDATLGIRSLSSMAAVTGTVTAAVGTSALGVAALVLAIGSLAGAATYFLTKGKEVQQMFVDGRDPIGVYGEALAASKVRFEQAADQYLHMQQALKLTGPEWALNTKWTKENAMRLSEMLDKIEQFGRVVRSTKGVRDGYTQSFIDLGDKIRANKQMLADYTEQVNKTYGVVTKQDITEKLKTTLLDLRIMQKEGIDAQQIIAAAGPTILDVIERAKSMGVTVTPILSDMADAIKGKNKLWVEDLMASLPKIPKEAAESAEASRKALDEMGNKLEGSISGGFGRGMEAGTNFGKQQLDAFIATVEQTPITFKIEGDWTSFRDQCKKHGVNFAMDTY